MMSKRWCGVQSKLRVAVAIACGGVAFMAQAAGWTVGQVAPLSGADASQG